MRSWFVSLGIHVGVVAALWGVGQQAASHVLPGREPVRVRFTAPAPLPPRAMHAAAGAPGKPRKAGAVSSRTVTLPTPDSHPASLPVPDPTNLKPVDSAVAADPVVIADTEGTGTGSGKPGGGAGSGSGEAGASAARETPGVDWGVYTDRVSRLIAKHRHYPAAAVELGLEGDVEVLVVIKADGFLKAPPKVARSSGHASLDSEALKMVERALPLPSLAAGADNGVTLRVPVSFRLDS